MKRFTALISIFLLFFSFPLIASAAESSQKLLPLQNEQLLAVLQRSDYKDWNFYQPSARETDTDTSSEHALEQLNTFPIVACRNDSICLIILKKANGQWTVSAVNEQALVREGLVLKTFSIDESYSELDRIQSVYFDFEDTAENTLTLSLQLSDIYPSYFSSIYSENVSIILNYDRGITVQFDFPFLFRVSYEISPEQYIPFNVEAFSFSECPLTIEELFVPAFISPQSETASLFAFPDDSMEPVFRLHRGEAIYVVRQQHQTEWALVNYNGNLYFMHENEVSLYNEF